jgi:hypothetical protein
VFGQYHHKRAAGLVTAASDGHLDHGVSPSIS